MARRSRKGQVAQERQCNSVSDNYQWLGPKIFRRAYHMDYDSFWKVYSILKPYIDAATEEKKNYDVCKGGREGGNFSLPPVRNGLITLSVRLACANRYFAGGSPYDIMVAYCVGYTEVLKSVWIVVEAVNSCPAFIISYPDSLDKQKQIAAEFQAARTPGIMNCAGAIDGILIWILKPSEEISVWTKA